MNSITIRIRGMKKKNDTGKNIQKLLSEYIPHHYNIDRFNKNDSENYISKKDIIKYSYDVYQYKMIEINTINLLQLPTKIKVIHNTLGHIGNISSQDYEKVMTFINENTNIEYVITLSGGKHKLYDSILDKITIKEEPYSLQLSLSKKCTLKEQVENKNIIVSNTLEDTNSTENKDTLNEPLPYEHKSTVDNALKTNTDNNTTNATIKNTDFKFQPMLKYILVLAVVFGLIIKNLPVYLIGIIGIILIAIPVYKK